MKHPMKHIFEQKVYYSDTDAYGVVWHGSYLRWLEMGRVMLCEMMGHNLLDLEAQSIVLPVVNLNVKYKASAKLNYEMIIETTIQKLSSASVTFEQKIIDKNTGKTFIEAQVVVVAVDNNGKLYRKMPQILVDAFIDAMGSQESENFEEYAVK